MIEENLNLLRSEFDILKWIKEIEAIYVSVLSRRGLDAADSKGVPAGEQE